MAETASGTGELRESKAQLSALLEGAPIETMSLPHGSYDSELLRAAAVDFELVFTSDGCLNAVDRGRPPTVLARIEIPAEAIVGAAGEVRPELLALWLFRRPHATLATV